MFQGNFEPRPFMHHTMKASAVRLLLISLAATGTTCGEAMLQYFNTSWREITAKMPEIAEAGYQSLWLPPPSKASNGVSVGYDVWDRFDLGSSDQRGSVRTRYGTESELLDLVATAHRFGIRVYFDNIMNHNAFEVPLYNAFAPASTYPGFAPADFHLRRTDDGFFRMWDNVRNWNDGWQVQNLGISNLIDIATEPGPLNFNHGSYEGATTAKPRFIRHPDQPELYCHDAQGNYVGFGRSNGLTKAYLQANPEAYSERVEEMLNRALRWMVDRSKADGFRLDAVKHTPADFFGATYGADRDSSDYGYLGQAQRQFNLTRGFGDANHRDSVFNSEIPRDDAMMFGEHLGQPPAYGPYIEAGMRLIDNDLRSNFNNILGNPSAGLQGYQHPGYGGFSPEVTVMHAQSHDSDYAARRELQHAFYLTRSGIGLIYTDGNYHADVLGGSGGAFPRHANTAFLGQWGDIRIPNLVRIHEDFGRGWQKGRTGTNDLVTYERIDERGIAESNAALRERRGATMLVAINDNFSNGSGITGGTSFPSTAGGGSENNPDTNDEYLFQYARGYGSQVGFYKYASDLGSVVVAPGSYFVFAPRTPEESDLWRNAGGEPLTILQNGVPAPRMTVSRRDGPNGDPGFNPYGLPDPANNDFSYSFSVPRVTDGRNLDFVARADGSAENILLKLDGGIDLNGRGADAFLRDNPPGSSTDLFLGYEQPAFVRRQYAEIFAAKDTSRNQTGSAGAETYETIVGSGSVNLVPGPTGANTYQTDGGNQAAFLYHDPADTAGGSPAGGWTGGQTPLQYHESPAGITLWAKPNAVGVGFRMFAYLTADGSNPEGAGGTGLGTTTAVEMRYSHQDGNADWWTSGPIAKPADGTRLKYKIAVFKEGASSVYPSGPASVTRKKRMMTTFRVAGFDAGAVIHSPHNDHVSTTTGLAEGFHVLRARAFLKRDGKSPLHNTLTRTFYYDTRRPTGRIVFPGSDAQALEGSSYGVVVRADNSATRVSFKILDSDPANDDGGGNGSWADASEVTAGPGIDPGDPALTREFRFDYRNIPTNGSATLLVRIRETSSSNDDAADDASGHFTTLIRRLGSPPPALDTDQDGLPDAWESQHSLNPLDNGNLPLDGSTADPANGPEGDPDGDGIRNAAEWLTSLQPRKADAAAFPKVVLTRGLTSVRLSFPTQPNRTYQFQVSDNLTTWNNLGSRHVTTINAAPGVHRADDPIPPTSGKRYYRMLIQTPPPP